jgi:transcriptional regulator with XRE-family HTH domain
MQTTKSDGAAIRRLREERGLHAYELAERAGIAKRFLSQIENDLRDGSAPTRLKIARALGVPLSQITYTVDRRPRTRRVAA